ncbi:MAG: hypothetical protein DRH24_08790 [Deltaproteobacteria bacterium]|nr:MAG: hypothetical protein DRH24_08790 [Deltaproteobacteria bacterium]
MSIVFPEVIPVADLRAAVSADYRPKEIQRRNWLYDSEAFKRHKQEFLIKRQIEMHGFNREYQERLKRTPYVNVYAPIIAWWGNAVIQDPPHVEGGLSYLNDELPLVVRSLVNDCLLHQRSWLHLRMINDEPHFDVVDALAVDDWCDDYLRTSSSKTVRLSPFNGKTTQIDYWDYFTPDVHVRYEYDHARQQNQQNPVALRSLEEPIDFVPFWEFTVPVGLHLGAQLEDLAVSAFNLQSALIWLQSKQAYSIFVIKTQQQLDKVILSESSALKLSPDDDAQYVTPGNAPGDQLADTIDRTIADMYRIAHESALLAVGQNANESGLSKRLDYTSLAVSLRFIREGVKAVLNDALIDAAKILKISPPTLQGLEEMEPTEPTEEQDDGTGQQPTDTAAATPADATGDALTGPGSVTT